MVKNCENSVFQVIFVKKYKKNARVGTISRDGRVTGNKHIFVKAYAVQNKSHYFGLCLLMFPNSHGRHPPV